MFIYRINQAFAAAVGLFAFSRLFTAHQGLLPHFRLALLIYSSILILTISNFAQKNLVGQERYTRFGALLLLTSTGIYLTFLTSNLLLLGLGWSVSGAGAALLVNHANLHQSRRAAVIVARSFLVSDLSLWGAIALAHFNQIDPFAPWGSDTFHGSTLLNLIALLFALAGIIRSGLFPAMRWLILTIEAPTPLSALLHAGIVNGFGYLLVALPIIQSVRYFVVGIGLLTIVLALSIMRHRHDEKGKLANGTSMQMAFMALEGVLGIPGIVLLHIVGHGSYKSWSFLRAGGAPLRKKSAIPIPLRNRPAIWVLLLLLSIYAACLGVGYTWVGRDFLLNLTVGSITLASALIFSIRLKKPLLVKSAIASYLAFLVYVAIVKLFSDLFAHTWQPSLLLLTLISSTIVLITVIFRTLSRVWTLRLASALNGYRTNRSSIERDDLRKNHARNISRDELLEIIEITGAPFSGGGPLSQIVAQDSLVGLHNLEFNDAALVASEFGISMYSSSEKYLSYLEQGIIKREVLADLLRAMHSEQDIEALIDLTRRHAQLFKLASKSTVENEVTIQSNWWCSQAWFDGESGDEGGAYGIWRTNLGRERASLFPVEPIAALAQSLEALISRSEPRAEVTPRQVISTLRELISLDISWFLYAKSLGREAEVSLLALRATIALLTATDLPPVKSDIAPGAQYWQRALELSFSTQLVDGMVRSAARKSSEQGKNLALVTCIDVRSDLLRQRVEELEGVCTFGMAGFFGVDICVIPNGPSTKSHQNYAPIILQPSIEISDGRDEKFSWLLPTLWKYATSGTGALAMAEGFGLMNGVLNALNTFAPHVAGKVNRYFNPPRWLGETGGDLSSLSLEQKLAYASNIISIVPLRGLSEVVFVGHGADASNTPFRSMFECGACGGNNGVLNARFAAKLMNDPDVQNYLSEEFNQSPARFFAAEHNTTRGTLDFDPDAIPEPSQGASQELVTLASRIATLPRRAYPGSDDLIESEISSALAWWQVFPEWGLSANAACVIGPRYLTAQVNLGSRVFLHDYNWVEDLDGTILSSILSGPGVVMQMINFAYNIAVTDPDNFSSGDKTRHNVLGEAGVLLGSEGPLYRGLPWQSISTLADLSEQEAKGHIPIRLQIFVAAPQAHLDSALENSTLAPLVTSGWVALHSLSEAGFCNP